MNTLRCAQDISKCYLPNENFTEYIIEELSRELAGRVMTVISSGDPYVVKLEKVKTIDIPENYSVQYRQDLKIQRMIFCENCSKRKRNGFCLEHMRYEKDGGYCSCAELKTEEESIREVARGFMELVDATTDRKTEQTERSRR